MDVIEPAPVAGRERGTRFNGSSPWGPWVVVRNIGMDRHFVAGHAFRDRLSI
jgi:hypothetical protein